MNEQTLLIWSRLWVLSERQSLRWKRDETACLSMTISLPSVQAQVLALQSPTAENIPRRLPLHFDYWSVNNEECSRNTCHVDVAAARPTRLREAMGWGDCERLVGNRSSEANTPMGSSRSVQLILRGRAVIGRSGNEAWTESLLHSALTGRNWFTEHAISKTQLVFITHIWHIQWKCHKPDINIDFFIIFFALVAKT